MNKSKITLISSIILILGLVAITQMIEIEKAISQDMAPTLSAETQTCLGCHSSTMPATVAQWQDSKHYENSVGCYECHQADESDPDAMNHMGMTIAVIVSPLDCAKCHQGEVDQFMASHHASATQFTGSLDNYLGEIVEGSAAAVQGCQQCHGSTVKVLEDGSLDASTWPNTGMGRINPDGSNGACTACHARHSFSKAQARRPENCGKCHMGPDHPQIEIYNESKHGIQFYAHVDDMNLESDHWVVGEDYYSAPTCATCHMSATRDLPVTHDVGDRISWTLRPPISTKLENWEQRREDMLNVCTACHNPQFTENFFTQYDAAVELYNTKFAEPGVELMAYLKDNGMITASPFDDHIEWVWFEIWHHEGRRARHGASMMGPDYTQWHGFYEVAKHFYFEFLPMARELGADEKVDEILSRPEHAWTQGLSPEQIQMQIEFYRERYDQ
jgi:hypothetical protein